LGEFWLCRLAKMNKLVINNALLLAATNPIGEIMLFASPMARGFSYRQPAALHLPMTRKK
jgi:hypothetical protein